MVKEVAERRNGGRAKEAEEAFYGLADHHALLVYIY
jgi:hypothetical protein